MIPFDDSSIPKAVYSTATTGSANVSGVDLYRQGVELTLPQHYAFGIAKTHAGYFDTNHEIPQQQFGFSREPLRTESSFDDIPKMNPVDYVNAYRGTSPDQYHPYSSMEYQIVRDNVSSIDGAMEPLTIRDVVKFKSIYGKVEPHSIKANHESGNSSFYGKGDQVVGVYKRSDQKMGDYFFVDGQDRMGNLTIVNEIEDRSDTRRLGAFDDSQVRDGFILDDTMNLDAELLAALDDCSPNTDNYVGVDYDSASNGWD